MNYKGLQKGKRENAKLQLKESIDRMIAVNKIKRCIDPKIKEAIFAVKVLDAKNQAEGNMSIFTKQKIDISIENFWCGFTFRQVTYPKKYEVSNIILPENRTTV